MNKEMNRILVKNLLIVSLFFGFQRIVQAQNAPVVTATIVANAIPGQQVTIPITVSNFNNIGSLSLSLEYDHTKLQFVSATTNSSLGGICNTGDNVFTTTKHRLIMNWSNLNGKSLPDGTIIVNYIFTYLSGSPTLQWYEDGSSCDFTDSKAHKLNDIPTSTYYINGSVCGALPNTVSINGATIVCSGRTDLEYSVPLDPTITYNWNYSGTGATIVAINNTAKINFSASATPGTLKVTASNACYSCTGSKDITLISLLTPTFTAGPTNIDIHSSGNVYTTQSGKVNYIWTVTGGMITAGGSTLDNNATITWNTAGNQSVSVKYDDQTLCTPLTPTLYPVTVRPAVITMIGITANKVYDGTANVSPNAYSATLIGVAKPDAVTINAMGATATFDDKNVGTGKHVTTSGFTLSGLNAGNYTLVQPTTTANITPAYLTISGVTANSKTYDGFKTAILNNGTATLSRVLNSDKVILNTLNATGNFYEKNAGSRKTVITSGFSLTGEDASNYSLIQPLPLADISLSEITISGVIAANKIYDGTTTASLNTVSATLKGVYSTDNVILNKTGASGNFSNKQVANGKTVTTNGFILGGMDAVNYTLLQPVATGSIIPATITITGLTANKVYSGTVAISLNLGYAALVGIAASDIVTLNTTGVTATFADKNAGTGKIVNATGFKLEGINISNYVMTSPVITGTITPAVLTISGVIANNKTYDGNIIATLNTESAKLTGIIGTDVVSLLTSETTGSFASKNAASGNKVTTSGFMLGGVNADNYILVQPTTIASIIPNGLSINILGVTADNKIYDGTTDANLNIVHATMVGVISPDIVILNMVNVNGTFVDKNVGNSKTIITSGFSISGENAGNYTMMQPLVEANILPFASPLTISGVIANNKTYDGTINDILNTGSATLAGMISTDIVTLNVNDAIGTFADKKASLDKQLTTTGFKLDGMDAINYTLIQPTLKANINVAPITVTGITANNKIYDETVTTLLNTGSAVLVGVISPDDVQLFSTDAIGTFSDKNVSPGKMVTPTGLIINGADAGNYVFINPFLTADITTRSLKITAKNVSKCFELNYIFAGDTFTSEGLVNNDAVNNVTLTSNGVYPEAIAGNYDIIPGDAEGTGLSNYVITYMKGNLIVNPLANQPAEFLISTSTVCKGVAGVAYTVPKDELVTYNWSYSGTGVTINGNINAATLDFSTSATSGILSVTASTSCGTSVARTLLITVNALKNRPVIKLVDKTLFSNIGEGNQWYKDLILIPGATSQNYTPIENGIYFNVNSNRSCYTYTSNSIEVIIPNTEKYIKNTFQIFPNPAKDYFILRSKDAMPETMRFSILSSECLLIKNYELTNKFVSRECMIDIRHFSPGLYFILIHTGQKTITQKLIVL